MNPSSTIKPYDVQEADFMDLMGQRRFNLLETLKLLKERDLGLRLALQMHFNLIDEEVNKELKQNFYDKIVNATAVYNFDSMAGQETEEHYIDALTLLADDLIDTIYVCYSMLNKVGIPTEEVWNEVHGSNMAKATKCEHIAGPASEPAGWLHYKPEECPHCEGTGMAVLRRADGKVLKPEGWKPPNIKAIIMKELQRCLNIENEGLDGKGS